MIKNTKAIITFAVALVALTSLAKGLYCGAGAMSSMEARIERASGNTNAVSTRAQNAQRKSRKAQAAVAAETKRQNEAIKEQMKNSGCCSKSQSWSGKCPASSSCTSCKKVLVTKSCDGTVTATTTSRSGKTTTTTLYKTSSSDGKAKSYTKSVRCGAKKSK